MVPSQHELKSRHQVVNLDRYQVVNLNRFRVVNLNRRQVVSLIRCVVVNLTEFSIDGPVLINIMTNPESLAMPPKIEWEQVKGYALSISKLMLGGKMDEVFDILESNHKHLKEIL
jgi:hypothetical protein